jgi:transposase-like protein
MEDLGNNADDGLENDERPRKRKTFYTLWEKKDIVEEAYAAPLRVKATARKYGLQPKQIRRWRLNANALNELPHYPERRTVEERGVIKKSNENAEGPNIHTTTSSTPCSLRVGWILLSTSSGSGRLCYRSWMEEMAT